MMIATVFLLHRRGNSKVHGKKFFSVCGPLSSQVASLKMLIGFCRGAGSKLIPPKPPNTNRILSADGARARNCPAEQRSDYQDQ